MKIKKIFISIFKRIKNYIGIEICVRKWRKKNANNYTSLDKRSINIKLALENTHIGNHTYGNLRINYHPSTGNNKLKIGNYVSIASDVTFIMGGNHFYNRISTYPFEFMLNNNIPEVDAFSKGDIIIEDDVWIANKSIILSGVTIGRGAIVGAGSVITKNIPPYAIVAGNPAKIIKYRFDEYVINKLYKLDFSKIDKELVFKNIESFYIDLNKENIDKIIETIK